MPTDVLGAKPAAEPEHDEPEHDEHLHPHPITERHRRIKQELNLIALMNEALDRRRGARLRELLDEYRRTFPEDPNRLQRGYEVIADCLEKPGEVSRATAAEYYATHKASILRRTIRRVCLESES